MAKKNTKKSLNRAKYEMAGYITVDTGTVQVGDPCYEQDLEFADESNWIDDVAEIPHNSGQDWARTNGINKAIAVMSGFGDGVYPVEIKRCLISGAIKELRVKFF